MEIIHKKHCRDVSEQQGQKETFFLYAKMAENEIMDGISRASSKNSMNQQRIP